MSGNYVKLLSSLVALATLAGCNSTGMNGMFSSDKSKTPANASTNPVVVQGQCPQVYLREGTAVYSQYTNGARKKKKSDEPAPPQDPKTLVMQATLDETTRQCFQTDQGLRMTVLVHMRVVLGPQGKPGSSFTMPIRIAATDGDQTLYSELTKFPITLAPGQSNGQFVFTKENMMLKTTPGGLARVFAGIDEGPYDTK